MADNIYKKMLAITEEIGTVAKNLSVGFGKGQYKAVGEADVLAAVKPIEIKHGVYSYPMERNIIDKGELVSSYDGKDKRQIYLRVEVKYRFVNIDNPNDYIDITSYGDGVDSQDKAPGKAMTYADKYALLKAYKIQTGEDPDQEESKPLVERQPANNPRIGVERAKALEQRLLKAGNAGIAIPKLISQYGVSRTEDLTEEQLRHIEMRLAKSENNRQGQ